MDRIYTPRAVADALAGAVAGSPRVVADFTAGEGALLDAAARRWPQAQAVALDIDPSAVAQLRVAHPEGTIHEGDFLDPPAAVTALRGTIDAVLLNPPFSCRGNAWLAAEVDGEAVRCSRAMAFVCRALAYLSEGGELVCIVPAACLTSAKDRAARAAIGSRYGVAVLEASVGSVFDGRAVAVAQLRIVRGRLPSNAWRLPPQAAEVRRLHADYAVVVGRGATAVHETPDGAAGVPFVHTTDLRHGVWRPSARRSTRPADLDDQPALLLPRVGRPDRRKLVRIAGGPVVLSDCLFWLRTEPAGHEAELQRILLDDWAGVAVLYGGSCAPYATLAGLLDLLASRGLSARIHRRARPPAAAQRPATASVADVSPGRRRARS